MYKYQQERLGDSVPIIERMFDYANAAGNYDKFAMMTDYMGVYAPMGFGSNDANVDAYNDGGFIERMADVDSMTGGILVGRNPHHSFDFPFGNQQDLEDWYDVRGIDNLKADITGGASAKGYLFIEQVRSY